MRQSKITQLTTIKLGFLTKFSKKHIFLTIFIVTKSTNSVQSIHCRRSSLTNSTPWMSNWRVPSRTGASSGRQASKSSRFVLPSPASQRLSSRIMRRLRPQRPSYSLLSRNKESSPSKPRLRDLRQKSTLNLRLKLTRLKWTSKL